MRWRKLLTVPKGVMPRHHQDPAAALGFSFPGLATRRKTLYRWLHGGYMD
jgi:hypothetical protein